MKWQSQKDQLLIETDELNLAKCMFGDAPYSEASR